MKAYTQAEFEHAIESGDWRAEGEFMIWFRMIWKLLEQEKLHLYSNFAEYLSLLSLIQGSCRIYQMYASRFLEEDDDPEQPLLAFDLDDLAKEMLANTDLGTVYDGQDADGIDPQALLKQVLSDNLRTDDAMTPVFALLKRTLGRERTFAALYFCMNYEKFSVEPWETDEYYYGDIEDSDELAAAVSENWDYEQRKQYAACADENEILDMILNETDVPRLEAYGWLAEYM
ncbi:MAG: hypothetical protein IKH27_04470 [Oscillospiraceae bacterium]|nr:hypothetical protein [Oscillospiraceae bacterium]